MLSAGLSRLQPLRTGGFQHQCACKLQVASSAVCKGFFSQAMQHHCMVAIQADLLLDLN